MFDFETTVSGIEYKVRKLVESNQELRQQVETLNNELTELQQVMNSQNILINNLKEQNKILKLGNTLNEKGDSAEIKLKINQLIRTIDKSLTILTKVD